ncbi:hypothetical protein [Prauserella flavalba]|uniref:hypothetical protein n=1 Tax=Prauserella flavalba TaxID=1477506 RepID=UPI0036ED411B
MRVGDTFVISGRGLTVTGELLLPVRVDEKLDVLHDGKERPLRVTGMLIDKEQVESAVPGTKVALMLSKWQLPTI